MPSTARDEEMTVKNGSIPGVRSVFCVRLCDDGQPGVATGEDRRGSREQSLL